jgi:homoserine kinase
MLFVFVCRNGAETAPFRHTITYSAALVRMMGWAGGGVGVRVPATSANLGPGFDSLGLALSLYDDIEAGITDGGLSIAISGEGEALADAGEQHLVVRAMRAGFAAFAGEQPPGLGLRCVNRIPHGRGLGSSAAAIVGGLLASWALSGRVEASPGRVDTPSGRVEGELLELATAIEGHPDNVAACLGGGLTIAWTVAPGPRMVRLMPVAGITPVICVAPAPVRTEVARKALPDTVPHADAAANAGRCALLIAALTERPDLLFDATEDWLHQDYRADAMPDTQALVRAFRAAGIPAVVSGAGPSVLAFLSAAGEVAEPDLDSLGSIVRETGKAWRISSLDVAREGARLVCPTGSWDAVRRATPLLRDTDGCEGMQ